MIGRLAELARAGERAVLFTVVEGPGAGAKRLVVEGGEQLGDGVPEEALGQFDEILRRGRNQLVELEDGSKVFAEWYGPPPRLFVYGAVDTAETLCKAAKLLGWTAIVADARAKFATAERIPSADRLIVEWPDEALAQVAPDHQTAVVVLTHDDKFDEPALKGALETEAFYIGALGSRRNQERRRERLLEAGVSEEALDRISGPCGLDIGADSQSETALSILAEILAVRAGREGGPLKTAKTNPRRSGLNSGRERTRPFATRLVPGTEPCPLGTMWTASRNEGGIARTATSGAWHDVRTARVTNGMLPRRIGMEKIRKPTSSRSSIPTATPSCAAPRPSLRGRAT